MEIHKGELEATFVFGYSLACFAGHLTYLLVRAALSSPHAQNLTVPINGLFIFLLGLSTLVVCIAVLPSYILVRVVVGRTAFSTLGNACGFGVVCVMLSTPLLTWIGNHIDFGGPRPYLPLLLSSLFQSPTYIPSYVISGLVGGCVYWITEFVMPSRLARPQKP